MIHPLNWVGLSSPVAASESPMPLQVTSPNSLLHHVVDLGALISLVCALSRVNQTLVHVFLGSQEQAHKKYPEMF